MKINVGDYVRTKEFGINRIKWFDNEEPILENGFTALQSSGYKSSPNIIDLIEVGDIIITKHPAFNKEWLEKINNKEMLKIRKKFIEEGSLILISIVTKEQFESMEYKI